MSESTALTVPGLRIRNPVTGRHSWLSLAADGTYFQSQQNSDESHVPALLSANPIVASQPTIYGGLVAGRWYSITIGFDGFLAYGSVAIQSGSGQLYGTPYVGSGAAAWGMTFYYAPQPNDILAFTVYSRNWSGSAIRRWSPLTATTGPQLTYASPYYFFDGVATWATVGFTKPVSTVGELYPTDANGLAAGTLQSFSLSGDGYSAVILVTIGPTATGLRIVNANGRDGSYTWYHDLPITRLIGAKASLADVKTPAGVSIVAGTAIDITFEFGEQLSAFGPTVTAGGGTISNLVFAAPSDTAVVTYTPGTPGVQTIQVFTRDANDGAEGTITHSFTALGPPAIVAGSITPAVLADDWPTEVTLLFDKPIASIGGVALVDLAGAPAGTVTGVSINNSTMVTFTATAAATSNRLVFTSVAAADGTSAASLEAPITRQAPTAPLLSSAQKDTSVLADFVTGAQTSVTFTFSEPLQTFTPSISAGGGTIDAVTFNPPSTTATIQLTPGPTPGLNSISIYIKDNVDGGTDTISYSFTSRAPVLATIVAVEPASLPSGSPTDVVVTFSEPIASVPSAGISLTGTGTIDTARFSFPYLGDNTKARIGITSTSVTGITFAGIVDVNEGATASPSASITTAGPTPLHYLDASNESLFTYDATTKVISAISTPGLAYSSVGGRWMANTLNGKATIDFAGLSSIIATQDFSTFIGGSWTFSVVLRAQGIPSGAGPYCVGVGMWGIIRIDYIPNATTDYISVWPFTLGGRAEAESAGATSSYINLGQWYLFTITRQAGQDTRYYVNGTLSGYGGQGTNGDAKNFVLNSYERTSANGNQSAFAEVRLYNQYLSAASVAALYAEVQTKWGIP